MAGPGTDPLEAQDALYCVNHPNRETLLRCSKCLDPICTKCAIHTPVGYRCPKCARAPRSPLHDLQPQHYGLALLVGLGCSLVAGAVATQPGLWFSVILAMPAGGLIAEAVLRSIRWRRGRVVQVLAAACIIVGAAVGPWLWAALRQGSLAVLPQNPLLYLATLLRLNTIAYAVVAVIAAVARLR